MNTSHKHASYDETEIAKFEAMAAEWWDPNGKFKPLHMLNPTRLKFITDNIAAHHMINLDGDAPLAGLSIVDIGCGGGLVAEPLARLGAKMLGIDAAERNIPVAELHAAQSGLSIDYRHGFAETLVDEGAQFDVVLALEIIEHVADPKAFFQTLVSLTKPGGLILVSTINRNPKSYMMAIVGAEYIMRWLPKGTHDWNKFLTPDEVEAYAQTPEVTLVDKQGFVFNPLQFSWRLSRRDLSVNYAMAFTKAT